MIDEHMVQTMLTKRFAYFKVLSEMQNYSQAAEALNISQPALSQQIRHLEEDWGTPLVEYTNHRIKITPSGKLVLKLIEDVEIQVTKLRHQVNDITNVSSGEINVGILMAIDMLDLSSFVGKLHRAKPNLIINVIALTRQEIIRKLLAHDIDVAITYSFSNSNYNRDQFVINKIKKDQFYLVHDKNSFDKTSLTLKDLSHESIAIYTDYYDDEFDRSFSTVKGDSPEIAGRFSTPSQILRFAIETGGSALLPKSYVQTSEFHDIVKHAHAVDRIQSTPINSKAASIDMDIIYHKNDSPSNAVKFFVNQLKQYRKDNLLV